jgi:hypothetical protein
VYGRRSCNQLCVRVYFMNWRRMNLESTTRTGAACFLSALYVAVSATALGRGQEHRGGAVYIMNGILNLRRWGGRAHDLTMRIEWKANVLVI